jgi:hypothetical protein
MISHSPGIPESQHFKHRLKCVWKRSALSRISTNTSWKSWLNVSRKYWVKSLRFRQGNNQEFVRIYRMGVSRSPEWYIRIHFPYRITQLGAPLLILSVLYKRMAESLILQGKLEKSRADEDLLRIWESTRRKINSMIDVVNSHSRRCSGTPPPSSILKKVGLNDCTIQAQF